MAGRAIVAAKARGKAVLDSPVILREDLDGDLVAALPALLRFALATVATAARGKAGPSESTAFTPAEVKGRLVAELHASVLAALERGVARGELPGGVAWVVTKGKPYLFLVENLRPRHPSPGTAAVPHGIPPAVAEEATAPPRRATSDFAPAFRAAFEHLDRRNGSTNFVKLAELRRALSDFDRDAFDGGLRALRVAGEFSLDSHEGLHGTLTPEEREAGVREAGSLLIYVSRR
jgi:hypothetical protein